MTLKEMEFEATMLWLRQGFQGDILDSEVDALAYATDASVYQQRPTLVLCPANQQDVEMAISLAARLECGLIPRAGGTSLAGQVVGDGIVVDVSRNMNKILEINTAEQWVRVQPGIIRDELNRQLAQHGLFFGPETSTSNRATIGGMLGNNSCGSNSIVYGTTRDNTLAVAGLLSDGCHAEFGPLDEDQLKQIRAQQKPDRRQQIIADTIKLLDDQEVQERIRNEFPHPDTSRRNTGYAIDLLANSQPFGGRRPLNFVDLVAGSEGTLFFATDIRLKCHPLPPNTSGLLCLQFASVSDALKATQTVMQHCHQDLSGTSANVFACELIDHLVIEGARRNLAQSANLDFVVGQPAAVLIVDIRANHRAAVDEHAKTIDRDLQSTALEYHSSVLFGDSVDKVWQVRKAGLGVVANVVGDDKPITVIEDAAVPVEALPEYITEVDQLLSQRFNVSCVHYGHAGAGELHLRPILNLKTEQGVQQFTEIAESVAAIAKKHGGSLSGEHGDGRLRAPLIPNMIGPANYELLKQVKRIWDPRNVFNPGKIVDATKMTDDLRYQTQHQPAKLKTAFDFSDTGGIQRAAEMCSGSGDCRKTELATGTMCPSFMATRQERDSTRARANVLRQVIADPTIDNPLADQRVHDVMQLCLGCKACKSECPSNVDVARMKSEALHQRYKQLGVPKHAKRIAKFANMARRVSWAAGLANWLAAVGPSAAFLKRGLGVHKNRSLPKIKRRSLRHWFQNHSPAANAGSKGRVLFFGDEFTNHIDVRVGIATIELLEHIGFQVDWPQHDESGRAAIAQGLLDQAKINAQENVRVFSELLKSDDETYVVGVEPSALLSFRDEYPDLVAANLRDQAKQVAARTKLIDEFISDLIAARRIDANLFTNQTREIWLHGHCHQRALSSMRDTVRMLQLPKNHSVKMIPSGCCGMAGAFGYQQQNFDLSMQIGELVLFPTIRRLPKKDEVCVAANGTSCRHQILDGTGVKSQHPVQILHRSLVTNN